MKKLAIIGHFGFGTESLDGQTIKTKELARALCERFGEHMVLEVDTHSWKKNPLRFTKQVYQTVNKAENVLIMPDQNGLRVITPLLVFARKRNAKCKLCYSVIGGWLAPFLKKREWLKNQLKTFEKIYVETDTMKKDLEQQGFSNVQIMPNCKELRVLKPEELTYSYMEPYKLCTFSRVLREKGIEDAIDAVKKVNLHFGRVVYTLDIFGQIDQTQQQWFAELQRTLPEYVQYCGTVPFHKSVEVLKGYFVLLFPTRFFTEGVPGTVIDAYAAGVPVIAARWESFADVVDEGITGYGYVFGECEKLYEALVEIVMDPDRILMLKRNCLQKAQEYLPEVSADIFLRSIGV